MREIRSSGSVGGPWGNLWPYPESWNIEWTVLIVCFHSIEL
jgi:hypothetical protein